MSNNEVTKVEKLCYFVYDNDSGEDTRAFDTLEEAKRYCRNQLLDESNYYDFEIYEARPILTVERDVVFKPYPETYASVNENLANDDYRYRSGGGGIGT